MAMLSIQEMVDKTEDQRHNIKKLLGSGTFHPTEASILHGQKPAVKAELLESLQNIPLREFLAKSGTTGIAGAAYLVPEALHTSLMAASYRSDRVPQFTAQIVNGWAGGDLAVDIAVRQAVGSTTGSGKWSLRPEQFSSGGAIPVQTVEAVKATLSPKSFGTPLHIGLDLVEDSGIAPDLITWHVNHAAQQIGQYATDLAIADLKAASDGDGTQCTVTAGTNTTTNLQVLEAIREVGAEFWNPNTMLITNEAWCDTVAHGVEVAGGAAGDYYTFTQGLGFPAIPEGYDAKFQVLDTVINNSSQLCLDVASSKLRACITIVLDRSAALLCGRKRWMRIENYGDPVHDLHNAIVTCRQDCVTLYKDASCEITEDSGI